MDDNIKWVTIKGRRIPIYPKKSKNKSEENKKTNKKCSIISKKEYARIQHMVDTYPKKFKHGKHSTVLDNTWYFFRVDVDSCVTIDIRIKNIDSDYALELEEDYKNGW